MFSNQYKSPIVFNFNSRKCNIIFFNIILYEFFLQLMNMILFDNTQIFYQKYVHVYQLNK
jgi:hypothetical protein